MTPTVTDFDTITLERDGPVAVLTLNRPARLNAMSKQMLREMIAACDAVEADDTVRALVLTGAGKAFSAGFDLQDQAANPPQGRDRWRRALQLDFDTVMRFWRLSKPTIAAVRGPALAGGCELAMACDLTIAEEGARFGEPELRFGAGIVVMLLPWLAGPKKAKEIFLLGLDDLSAQEACDLGMINRVVAPDDLMPTALRMARQIAVVDPMVVRRTKEAVNRTMRIAGMETALDEALAMDLDLEAEGSDDKREFLRHLREGGLKAALAWREARFDV
ncbi:MAG: enoyl-CoA hydratase/isomerase family protein [Pseudomonadota bacterium]